MDRKDPTTEQESPVDQVRKDPRGSMPPKLAALRFKLGQKAKQQPEFRFYALYGHLLRVEVLETALATVAASDGCDTPGVDGITMSQIVNTEGGAAAYLEVIREELRAKSYRPQPVKRVYIPKANGKQRPLGIPSIRDRVVQTAVLLLLEPIFDADFLDCSYGFRPKRSAHGAIDEVQANLRAGYTAVYDADLQDYFDSIPHDKLMKGLETRLADGSMLRLIRLFLRAPVQEGKGPPRRPGGGVPQGGVVSPLLANAFLHWFDRAFFSKNGPAIWAKARLVRYADDFVVMARFIDHRIVGFIEEKIERRLGLVINREKTRVVQMKDEDTTLDFLGYTFRWSRSHRPGGGPRYWRAEASSKAQQRARDKLRELTSERFCWMPIKDVVERVNALLRGWLGYFSKGQPAKARRKLVRFAEQRLVRHLRRRSQRPYRPPAGVGFFQHVHDLGLIAPGEARG
ncbi:group II intron reverse transcriptase/maturase [Sorangium sp. So ce1000]|uniref:group II intron reverse transcriptase/maturase n=1 Tax=Sorangium sp. So ce1000 TaxID=3133325 RepID=UPI003F5DE3AF